MIALTRWSVKAYKMNVQIICFTLRRAISCNYFSSVQLVLIRNHGHVNI